MHAASSAAPGAPTLPPCPSLPAVPVGAAALDYRVLAAHGAERGGAFYLSCLTYAQVLWARGLAARAVLCLDRAMGADLRGDEAELIAWPLPYAAMAWFLTKTPPEVFIGNPRVHFQHYADRMNEPRREQRQWRAWACWALVRRPRPEWPADPRHAVVEPSEAEIATQLARHGHAGEVALWRGVLTAKP
jgi:hypothetical protein